MKAPPPLIVAGKLKNRNSTYLQYLQNYLHERVSRGIRWREHVLEAERMHGRVCKGTIYKQEKGYGTYLQFTQEFGHLHIVSVQIFKGRPETVWTRRNLFEVDYPFVENQTVLLRVTSHLATRETRHQLTRHQVKSSRCAGRPLGV